MSPGSLGVGVGSEDRWEGCACREKLGMLDLDKARLGRLLAWKNWKRSQCSFFCAPGSHRLLHIYETQL